MKGQKGIGISKHRKSGNSGKSPKMRQALRREAEKMEHKDHSRIKQPASSFTELFHSRR